MRRVLWLCCLYVFISCNGNPDQNANNTTDETVPIIGYTIQNVYPHDTTSYTQGLEWHDSVLYEGTGNYEHSKLLKTDWKTGKILQEIKTSTDNKVFGEGITIVNNLIYELTWKDHYVYVYDLNSFKKVKEFQWTFEGWGLTNNGKQLIISTGSNTLYFVNPETFKIESQVGVFDNYGPVSNLNELEYVDGFVYANQYETNYILKIDATNGKVVGKVDCTDILSKSGLPYNPLRYDITTGNVLNGIAYQSSSKTFFITGKLWPAMFQVKFN